MPLGPRFTISVFAIGCLLAFGGANASVSWVSGFDEEVVVAGLDKPTSFAYAADGRIFVAEKDGRVRVVSASGQLLATPFATVSVNTQTDRGLLGIALHPNFPGTPYVYLAYTTNLIPPSPINSYSRIHRITRMTANGDVAIAGSEIILVDNIPSDMDSHTGGSMRFGPDGKLYISTGDGADYDFVSSLALRSLDIDQLVGKILRINPDGSAPSDNPFYTTPTAIRSKVWQFGLRNPFKTVFRPSTGALYVEDVGWNTWEEVNVGGAGVSFGWPCFEGSAPQPQYQAAFPAQCAGVTGTAPLHFYPHNSFGGAVTGGAFFEGANYPVAYSGLLFLSDYTQHWIKAITLGSGETFSSIQDIASGDVPFKPVDLALAPDGNLHYLNIANVFSAPSGSINRILYVGSGNHAPRPVASASPGSGYAPLAVTFSATGSFDPDGDPLSYHWFFGDGAGADGFSVSHSYAANGTFVATLQASDVSVTREAKVSITVGSLPPAATILSPPPYRTYVTGETISFSGSATDPDEGTLGASGLRWTVILHHGNHEHAYQDSTGASGSFLAVDHGSAGEVFYYELVLTATDSTGLSDSRSISIMKNQPPVANAGADQSVPCGSPGPTVVLNGGGSSDPDNQPITSYSWVQTSGPAVSLTAASTSTASFTAPANPGGATLTFQLTVGDGHVFSQDSVSVAIQVPGEATGLGLAADTTTLTWSAGPGASVHDLLRGSLGPTGFTYNHSCFLGALPAPTGSDAASPTVNSGFYYLARGANACGPGTVGVASDLTARPNPLCP